MSTEEIEIYEVIKQNYNSTKQELLVALVQGLNHEESKRSLLKVSTNPDTQQSFFKVEEIA